MKKKHLLILFLNFSLLTFAQSSTILVQTIPVDTNLSNQGIPDTVDVWLSMINTAKSSIDLAQFYVSSENNEPLERVIQALEYASNRGVQMRLLVSNKLLKDYQETVDRLKKIKNLSIRVMDLSNKGGILHAKYWIIDQEKVFIGSQNFDWRALKHIHEIGVLSQNNYLVKTLHRLFEADWVISQSKNYTRHKFNHLPILSDPLIELVASPKELNPPGIRPALDALVELINSSQTSIYIQLLSYSPVSNKKYWPLIDRAIREAAIKRGVQIKLLVSHWNNKSPAKHYLKALDSYPNIEVRFTTIPSSGYEKIPFARVNHSKYMIVDGHTLWLGTSNWSKEYFDNSRNVEVILKDTGLSCQVLDVFKMLWTSSYTQSIRSK